MYDILQVFGAAWSPCALVDLMINLFGDIWQAASRTPNNFWSLPGFTWHWLWVWLIGIDSFLIRVGMPRIYAIFHYLFIFRCHRWNWKWARWVGSMGQVSFMPGLRRDRDNRKRINSGELTTCRLSIIWTSWYWYGAEGCAI